MHLIRFRHQNSIKYGTASAQSVTPIRGTSLSEALSAEPDGAPIPLSEIEILSPVARPGKILGIGVNYAAHAAESVSFIDTKKPEIQKWFNKQATAINDPYAEVHLPKVSEQLDYEGELVVVIGKRGRHVPRERAFEIVAGVTIGCDYSVRDWQRASQTMIMGKGFDTHAPAGPAIVTLDEIADLSALEVRTFVNGEKRQSGHVRDMVHDIPAQIAHLTAAFTLEPGDLIFTGTPAGVGAGFDPPKWLKAGDRVRVEIDQLGYIEQQIVTEPGTTVIG
ncbi:fumarylacetoacetate hydrolase family protein [uncultured Hyphomonas sp.]|uniref:fumarylacetoacetate hydrolase family protein n=1 Tax=uncultured Hyphomonas sp. TaxID=225298 RepID=UPI002AAB4151|nr:fumarylacetoacetate hydrolase family protein [uncultured Hyphomonas sp.]